MTVKELIEKLQKLDENLQVYDEDWHLIHIVAVEQFGDDENKKFVELS